MSAELIDFDALFDEKLAEYMKLNTGKYTEKQWESLIPRLYKEFGDIRIPRIGDTPKGYYAKMGDEELVDTLRRHVKEGVPVSDFLCRELEKRHCASFLIPLLMETDTELQTFAVNLIGADEGAVDAYFALLRREDTDEDVAETVVEQLKATADLAKKQALACFREGIRKDVMLEILSRCKERDEEIYRLLLDEFLQSGEIPMHAGYLAAYGDTRALPHLLEAIDREDIDYVEFQELKYAIEALGGEYTRPRDFSSDPYFQEIMGASAGVDIFSKPKP